MNATEERGEVKILPPRVLLAYCKFTTRHPKNNAMNTYMCLVCNYVYDEQEGDPESLIEVGTRWADVPQDWRCPDCGAGKEDFEAVDV